MCQNTIEDDKWYIICFKLQLSSGPSWGVESEEEEHMSTAEVIWNFKFKLNQNLQIKFIGLMRPRIILSSVIAQNTSNCLKEKEETEVQDELIEIMKYELWLGLIY